MESENTSAQPRRYGERRNEKRRAQLLLSDRAKKPVDDQVVGHTGVLDMSNWERPVGPGWVGQEFSTADLPDDQPAVEGVVQQ